MYVALAIILSLLSGSALAAPTERSADVRVITHCSAPNTVALTFDDGPHIYLNEIVDTLRNSSAVGTFFFNGNNFGCIYEDASAERVKYAYSNGMQVASHTWGHKDLTTLSRDQINDEMARTETAIHKITGALPAYTRPPFGSYNDLVLEVADSRRQTIANWDFDSGDSVGASVDEQKASYDELANRHPNNVLSLQHEVHETSAREVLPYAIHKLQGAGYRLVSLSECLNTSPYIEIGSPAVRDGSWHC
ncbi:carbohydrate esterase family 4 protein [Crassisporium funariophilum]|nr:carbohydrate esterase family 4 protein [Crassisporium funariophilum]